MRLYKTSGASQVEQDFALAFKGDCKLINSPLEGQFSCAMKPYLRQL